jgi:hypothetical protein
VSSKPSGRIFISYRRSDAQHIAGRLCDRLKSCFGDDAVFMDVDSIEPGLDVGEAIEHAVGACDVLLVLIGGRWLDAVDARGRRRLDDPNDLVVLEVAAALERRVRVVPVLVDGAEPPRSDDLPAALAALARLQSVRLDHSTFGGDVAALVAALERAFGTGVAPAPSDWSEDKFAMLARDPRPSSQRMVLIIDALAARPETTFSGRDLGAMSGLSRGELMGALNGFTRVRKLLWPDATPPSPIMVSYGPSTLAGQVEETFYRLPARHAECWKRARPILRSATPRNGPPPDRRARRR